MEVLSSTEDNELSQHQLNILMWLDISFGVVALVPMSLALHNFVMYIYSKKAYQLWLFYALILIQSSLMIYQSINLAMYPSKFPVEYCADEASKLDIVEYLIDVISFGIFLLIIVTIHLLSCSLDLIDTSQDFEKLREKNEYYKRKTYLVVGISWVAFAVLRVAVTSFEKAYLTALAATMSV